MDQKYFDEIKAREQAAQNGDVGVIQTSQLDIKPLIAEMTAEEAAEVLENMAEKDFQSDGAHFEADENIAVNYAASILRRVASGELAEIVHAHWKEIEPGHDILFECSNCGRIISTSWGSCEDDDTQGNNGCDPTEEWLCCPTCGALMDEKDDSHG